MNLKEKRKIEQEIQKNQKKEEVIEAALKVFKIQGIENTKMTDIAKEAEIGVASLYRYFKTKLDLSIEAACKVWQDELAEVKDYYTSESFLSKNGISKVQSLLEVFLLFYNKHQNFLQFIDEFDRYVVKEKVAPEKLKVYEKSIIDLKAIMMGALEEGKQDGTVCLQMDEEQFYFSITHALFSLSQKLLLRGNVLESDEYVQGEQQIKIIIDMAVNYIKVNV